MSGPRVSVVVVSYNTQDKILECLSRIPRDLETVVVDNASADGSPDAVSAGFPHVRLIRNAQNRGFGAANNQGLEAATGDLVLYLNSDAYAEPGAIERLTQEFEDASVVAAGGQLLNPDGSRQLSSANELTLWAVFCEQTLLERLFPHSPWLCPYWNSHRFHDASDTSQVMGACLMARPVERFDERFFLYCEDTELCKRLRRHGRIRYVPDARFVHDLGSSSARARWLAIARYNRGKELYFAIHHGRTAMAACWALNRLGALLRLVAWLTLAALTLGLMGRFRRQVATFARVLFAPLAGPPDPRGKR